MYLDELVKIPADQKDISRKKIKGVSYIYYSYGYSYDKSKGYTIPKNTSIGKSVDDAPGMMYPNQNYFKYFPDADLDRELPATSRSSCLRIGAYLVLKRLIAEYHLDEIMNRLIGQDGGLFLDLAVYSIICENNAGQYYPDYAYDHPLFTQGMKISSDSKVSDFIGSLSRDNSIAFQNEWNANHDHREKIYISYDATNKNCSAGDLDFAEYGHPKDDRGLPVINYSIAYDKDNSEPLFYEEYPGSIVDVSELQYMLEKAAGYGYRHVGFILDRGYFSESNIHFMDREGYDFVLMMKGHKALVADLVHEVQGDFEDHRQNSIRDYHVSGCTVKRKLFASDPEERYFHIYFSDRRKAQEKENLQEKIDRMAEVLKSREGKPMKEKAGFRKYFDLIYYHEGQEDELFECAKERYDVIDSEMSLCGYFVIVTSEQMTAAEALELYKSRDASEKLFRADKSYLGNRSFRIHSNESLDSRIFIEFVALILRNRFHRMLKDRMETTGKRNNYMTVPAAIHELEKIEMIRQPGGSYVMDHAVTATQKEILGAFGMNEAGVRKQAQELTIQLDAIQKKEHTDGEKKDHDG